MASETADSAGAPSQSKISLPPATSPPLGKCEATQIDRPAILYVDPGLCSNTLRQAVAVCVLVNAVIMGASAELKGSDAEVALSALEHVFTIVFLVEMCGKLYFFRFRYFANIWNSVEWLLVALAAVDLWVVPEDLGIRKLLIFRSVRVLQVVAAFHARSPLASLLEAIASSAASLAWIFSLFLICVYGAAVFAMTVLNQQDLSDLDMEYFSSIQGSMLTMLNMSLLVEWPAVARLIAGQRPFLLLFFIGYIAACSFAVLTLTLGVVADRTAISARSWEWTQVRDRKTKIMNEILQVADQIFVASEGGTGLTQAQLEHLVVGHPEVMELLLACEFPNGLHISDVCVLLDEEGCGRVRKDDFVNGMRRLLFNDMHRSCALTCAEVKQELRRGFAKVSQELHSCMDMTMAGISAGKSADAFGNLAEAPVTAHWMPATKTSTWTPEPAKKVFAGLQAAAAPITPGSLKQPDSEPGHRPQVGHSTLLDLLECHRKAMTSMMEQMAGWSHEQDRIIGDAMSLAAHRTNESSHPFSYRSMPSSRTSEASGREEKLQRLMAAKASAPPVAKESQELCPTCGRPMIKSNEGREDLVRGAINSAVEAEVPDVQLQPAAKPMVPKLALPIQFSGRIRPGLSLPLV